MLSAALAFFFSSEPRSVPENGRRMNAGVEKSEFFLFEPGQERLLDRRAVIASNGGAVGFLDSSVSCVGGNFGERRQFFLFFQFGESRDFGLLYLATKVEPKHVVVFVEVARRRKREFLVVARDIFPVSHGEHGRDSFPEESRVCDTIPDRASSVIARIRSVEQGEPYYEEEFCLVVNRKSTEQDLSEEVLANGENEGCEPEGEPQFGVCAASGFDGVHGSAEADDGDEGDAGIFARQIHRVPSRSNAVNWMRPNFTAARSSHQSACESVSVLGESSLVFLPKLESGERLALLFGLGPKQQPRAPSGRCGQFTHSGRMARASSPDAFIVRRQRVMVGAQARGDARVVTTRLDCLDDALAGRDAARPAGKRWAERFAFDVLWRRRVELQDESDDGVAELASHGGPVATFASCGRHLHPKQFPSKPEKVGVRLQVRRKGKGRPHEEERTAREPITAQNFNGHKSCASDGMH